MISHTLLKLLLTPAALVCAAATFAQVAMDLSLNRTVYMQYEPIYAAVTLRNDSGRALAFGHDPKLQGSCCSNSANEKTFFFLSGRGGISTRPGCCCAPAKSSVW